MQWSTQYKPFSGREALDALNDILFEAGFMEAAWDTSDGPVSILDALKYFQGNCWDDQHDGGTHKDDLVMVNRLFTFMKLPTECDDLMEVMALPDDQLQESNPELWWQQNP